MNRDWAEHISRSLAERKKAHLMRQSIVTEGAVGRYVSIANKRLLNFSSNDYLGLANHPEIIQAFRDAASSYGVGAGASHRVVGHSRSHAALEDQLANWTGRERALVFSSGYMANLGVLQTLLADADFVLADKLNHASLVDGLLASGHRLRRYRHCDNQDLQRHLLKAKSDCEKQSAIAHTSNQPKGVIVTDSVFSMDGDIADLPSLATIAANENCLLFIDDAHGFGVLGESGAGSAEYFGLTQNQLPVLVGTFGKALGVAGAFVAGGSELIEWIAQKARSYIYTTAMLPAQAAAVSASIELVQQDTGRRVHLHELIKYFRERILRLKFSEQVPEQIDSLTPIQPVLVGDSATALKLSEMLKQQGFLVVAIRAPTVPMGTARLRIGLSASHKFEDVDRLCDAIHQEGAKLGVLV